MVYELLWASLLHVCMYGVDFHVEELFCQSKVEIALVLKDYISHT